MKSVALILAKSQSNRLPEKNTRDFKGQPLFMVNVNKCLPIFDEVWVSSDSLDILKIAKAAGAYTVLRDEKLCGDTPNIPVYQHALDKMTGVDAIIAVHSCSPTIKEKLLVTAKGLMELGYSEVMSCHPIERDKDYHKQSFKIYGSIWAVRADKLRKYSDAYKPTPEVLLIDESIDIHYEEDFQEALQQ